MPTNLPNRAQITYTFGTTQNTAVSNLTNTTLNDQFTMTLTKTPLQTGVETGDNVTYILRIENTGAGNLYNPTITDNLGNTGAGASPLTIDTNALYYYNGNPTTGTQTPDADGITFTSNTVLEPGDNFVIVYTANVADGADGDVVNTANATANGGSATGPAVTADAAAGTITVTTPTSAELAILKSADKDTVVIGDTLTYTFTLINTGDEAADSVTFTDTFPPEFTPNTVTITQNGTTTTVPTTSYTLTDNTLTLPSADSTLVISVPASGADGPGVAIITVTGTVA